MLQRIACDAQLTGLIFSDGKPLRHGASVRTATTKQWRALIARDVDLDGRDKLYERMEERRGRKPTSQAQRVWEA